jgi:hypothetical protein
MHTVLFALMITFFAVCFAGAFCWCLQRTVASVPVRFWVLITRVIPWMHGDPWPGWHQNNDPNWVNEISQPMPALTGEVIPPRSLDAKVRATIARADAMAAQTREILAADDAKV